MTGGFVPIPLYPADAAGVPIDVDVRTRVESGGTGALLRKDGGGSQVFHLTNKNLFGRLFQLRSETPDVEVRFAGPVAVWSASEVVAGRLKTATPVPRAVAVDHPGECVPENGHALHVTVSVSTLLPGESVQPGDLVASTREPFAYQFRCEC